MLRTIITLLILWTGMTVSAASTVDDANEILTTANVSGGFIVHLGATDGELTAALRSGESVQVQALIEETAVADAARKAIAATGKYGNVSVLQFAGEILPYIDNLVNVVVVEDQGLVSDEEILRVLVPNGVVLKRGTDRHWQKTVKPRPENIDEWSHYLHDASGNAVAHDDVVNSPRHLQS